MKISLRERKTAAGTRTLYLDFYDRGRRQLEYLNLYLTGNPKQDKRTRELAGDILAKRRLEHVQGEHGFPSPTRQQDDFLAYCRTIAETKRAPNTQLVWQNAIQHLEAFADGSLSFDRLTEEYVRSFRDYLLSRLKQNSAGVYLARIQTALHQAVHDKILTRNPGDGIGIKKQENRREFLTLKELQLLERTECGNQAVKDAFLFSGFCGLRYSDVRALTWDKVHKAGPHYSIDFIMVKTGSPEQLPLSRQAGKILGAQKGQEYSPNITGEANPDAVFKLPAQQSIDKAIKRWVKRAGIAKRVSFHTARHSFATMGLTYGMDIYTMSKLLGHRDLSTTEIYAKIVDAKKRQAVDLIPNLSDGKRKSNVKKD
ncbi:MAG: site-specific integrase [Acidobacteriia bacterium]|nr:site-specific integrase [Terriglobia bacterium]